MKINLVAVGGTIGSRISDGEPMISDAATAQIASIIDADKVFDGFKMHSASAAFSDLDTLRSEVSRATVGADGVIITHGTDTLAYSATYLAYAFAGTAVPIVMCAADQPLTDVDSNGHDVLKAAKSFIARGERGVFVAYKNPGEVVRIHHGARLIPAHLHENFYFSLGGTAFNSLGGSSFINSGAMNGMDFSLSASNILCINPYVGMDYSVYRTDGLAAVIHSAYHSGRVNTVALNKFASDNASLPIFLLTGSKKYAANSFEKNIVLCGGTTHTALYFKLLIALKNGVKDIRAFATKNVCGEIVGQ